MTSRSPIRLGISRCLLGDLVRYDGGHRRNEFLVEILGKSVEWVPVCPEVEAGFGIPREPMRLVGVRQGPRLLTVSTDRDLTKPLKDFSVRKVEELRMLNLSGYVFKARSPSCGTELVPLYDRQGTVSLTGQGLFVRCFQKQFPLIPLTDEDGLVDPASRERFLRLVLGYHRWQTMLRRPVTLDRIAAFHQAEAEGLQEQSSAHFLSLDRLLSRAGRYGPKELAVRYGAIFMEALAVEPSTKQPGSALKSLQQYRTKRARG